MQHKNVRNEEGSAKKKKKRATVAILMRDSVNPDQVTSNLRSRKQLLFIGS
jgi:hypothetical protein